MFPNLKTRVRWALTALQGKPAIAHHHTISNTTITGKITLDRGEGGSVLVQGCRFESTDLPSHIVVTK